MPENRVALVLFNLGGPDSLGAVRPFLVNLFSDPAILGLPNPLRWILARVIAHRRAPLARVIYQKLGGASPLLPNTQAQAQALEKRLAERGTPVRCFVSMRYWHPRSTEVVAALEDWKPTRLILLPLYPQFSTTTTASSFAEFWACVQESDGWLHRNWEDLRPVSRCCYPTDPGLIAAQVDLIRPVLAQARQWGEPRLLFSAHGLPEKIIQKGDPYQHQCEETARAILSGLRACGEEVEALNCYQSRVGPLQWIGPSTEDEIHRAAQDKRPVVVVPIAFVSEHSETLVELDMEYRDLAEASGVPFYGRVPTVGTHPAFIEGLAEIVRGMLTKEKTCATSPCPKLFKACPSLHKEASHA